MVVSPESTITLGKVAAILGLVQGIAWSFLSLTCVILYYYEPNIHNPSSYQEYVNFLIYNVYLKDSAIPAMNDMIIRQKGFIAFMWTYLFSSILWCAASADLIGVWPDRKKPHYVLIRAWGILTAIISLIDLIFASLLFRDYAHCDDWADEIGIAKDWTEVSSCFLAVGIVMTLAARGYTLWVLNVVFSIVMIFTALKIRTHGDKNGTHYNCKIPRAKIPSQFNSLEHNFTNREKIISMNPMAPSRNIPPYLNRSSNFN